MLNAVEELRGLKVKKGTELRRTPNAEHRTPHVEDEESKS
jgi:hypothetical protein